MSIRIVLEAESEATGVAWGGVEQLLRQWAGARDVRLLAESLRRETDAMRVCAHAPQDLVGACAELHRLLYDSSVNVTLSVDRA